MALPPQTSTEDGMVAMWLDRYRPDGHETNTSQAYGADWRAFRSFTDKPLRMLTVPDLQAFSVSLAGMQPTSRGRRLSAIKSLITLAHETGYLPFDVGAPIKLPAIKDTLTERIMTEEQVQRLLWLTDAPERRGRFIRRNACLLRLLYGAGLRISEACGLLWRDVTERGDSGQINVFGKGGKTRVILLPAALFQRVCDLRTRDSGEDSPVFRSREGGPLDRSQVHRIVKAAAKRAKLPAAVSAHFLRHSHASHALDRGAPVHVVQTTLGHASLSTTTRYSHARPGDSSARYLNA
jgi:integrase/recombinase XerD